MDIDIGYLFLEIRLQSLIEEVTIFKVGKIGRTLVNTICFSEFLERFPDSNLLTERNPKF